MDGLTQVAAALVVFALVAATAAICHHLDRKDRT